MDIANHALVLEYDGSSWRKIPVAKKGWIDGLAYEAGTDTVFVGGDHLLGYLKIVPGGGGVFVSLLDQLPADARAIGSVHRVHATPVGIFFLAENRVLRWSGGHFESWPLGAGSTVNRLRGGWASGNFYVQNPENGLLRLENEVLSCTGSTKVRKMSGPPLTIDRAAHGVRAGARLLAACTSSRRDQRGNANDSH